MIGGISMPVMCNLIHNDYDRISDKVMRLGFGATLNFNVDLFFQRKDIKSTDKVKENFHREFLYKVNQDAPYRVKILRDFNYYFSIDYNTKDIRERTIITTDQIYFFIFNLKKVMQWFIGENGINTIFSKKDGRVFIPTHPEPIRINLAFGGYIEFEPAIDASSGYDVIGVRTYLNSDGVFFFMSYETLFSLYHMITTCNMYSLAQNMLNYIGRPEYGTNSINMNELSQNKYISNKPSFFDRVGAKSE
jgi:hypothetical protein